MFVAVFQLAAVLQMAVVHGVLTYKGFKNVLEVVIVEMIFCLDFTVGSKNLLKMVQGDVPLRDDVYRRVLKHLLLYSGQEIRLFGKMIG